MKDFVGKDAHIGDIVVFNEPRYTTLISGPILKFTPKGIKSKYTTYYGREMETFIAEWQFVIIESEGDKNG